MRKIIFISLVIIANIMFNACAPSTTFRSVPADAAIGKENVKYIYALPETVIKVNVDAKRVTTIPGPYHEYASDLLGIEGVPQEKTTVWNITGIHLETYQKADKNRYYLIQSKDALKVPGVLQTLAAKNLVLLPANMSASTFPDNVDPLQSEFVFQKVSSKPMVAEETDTLYKTLYRDSVFVKIPVYRTVMSQMTEEEKATEAASYIFNLRQGLFDLFTGEMDFYPDGKAAEVVAQEFNTLEQEYLNLFTGVKYTQHYRKSFTHIPDEGNNLKRAILFRFSEGEGFHEADGLTGRPVFIDVQQANDTQQLSELFNTMKNSAFENIIFYRVPDEATVTILRDTREIYKSRVPVSQFGAVVPHGVSKKQ